ncbi:MAG TPA: hypothetical protein VK686_04825 [Bryobacteraceae bacterium]|nr:hypothetical protein [Bryobacteraceae bacterium]
MKRYLIRSMVIATLLAGSGTVWAQTSFNQRSYPNVTDVYQSGLKAYYKTWSDLNHAQKGRVGNPGDWYRFDVARGQIDLLERTWQDGSLTRAQINDAIDDVQLVLTFNNVSDRDREVLSGDLEQLRNIRIQFSR